MATTGGPRYDYALVHEPKGTSYRGKPHRNGFSRLGEYKDKHDERTAHESAMFILSRKNRALPASLDAMKAAAQKYRRLDKPIQQASLEEVSARLGAVMETIQKRKKQHARDMRSLYEWHATVYRDEMEDMRRCKDEYSPNATKETGRLYAHSRLPRVNPTVRSFNSVVAQHRWAYLKSMIPLQREVKDLEEARIRKEEARVADEQRRRNELERQRIMKEKAFPTSIDDYHAKSPAVQKLVREYLTETYPLRRTRMIQQHMWDKEAAEKMLAMMQNNPAFAAVIAAAKIQDEYAASSNVTRDPRLARR
ncbi:uncharacterized protein SCHCODRAFT_02610006 [Schizophyllum commune H4-8]|nr:uncharacterized protein SCHCODRAFT_02610006 [Schizophyllum commune H4-8]KAI5897702.1 hypothetical protein SCHCODRAFT_02610006 [Schizophyllum commune H4-8]